MGDLTGPDNQDYDYDFSDDETGWFEGRLASGEVSLEDAA